ncbi:MAG: response regulator transcription factor [Bacteroidota bacterium]
MIRIIIADDHQIFIDGIRLLLEQDTDVLIVGEAQNGWQVLDLLESDTVDIVLLDIRMPKLDGLETMGKIAERFPDIKVLVLTMHEEIEYIKAILDKGARGYIFKNTNKKELHKAIRVLAEGGVYFSEEVKDKIMESHLHSPSRKTMTIPVHLTKRETEVLKLIAQEFKTHEIATRLCISTHTVETHRKNLIRKIGVRNIAGLAKYALKNGLAE